MPCGPKSWSVCTPALQPPTHARQADGRTDPVFGVAKCVRVCRLTASPEKEVEPPPDEERLTDGVAWRQFKRFVHRLEATYNINNPPGIRMGFEGGAKS